VMTISLWKRFCMNTYSARVLINARKCHWITIFFVCMSVCNSVPVCHCWRSRTEHICLLIAILIALDVVIKTRYIPRHAHAAFFLSPLAAWYRNYSLVVWKTRTTLPNAYQIKTSKLIVHLSPYSVSSWKMRNNPFSEMWFKF
jgi:hypothetical protein